MLGPIISAGANIIGGLLNSKATKDANAQSAALAQQNMEMQKEFAQQGLRWKIDDAFSRAHKVHPIYSLGSAGAAFSPVSASFTADTSIGNAVAAAGQNIGRAVHSTATQAERVDSFTKAAQALSLEKGALENEVLRTQLASENARLRQAATPPFPSANPYLVPGQTSSGPAELIKAKPLEVAPGVPGQPQSEGGSITDVGYARTSTGYAPVPSKDVKERIEDDFVQQALHLMRNNVLPSIGYNFNPPPFKAPEGKEWHFHIPTQEYRLQPKGQGWYERGFTVRDSR